MMDSFFYFSGVAAWIILGLGGILAFGDLVIEWTVNGVWTKREFLAFVADRLKRKYARS
jgi:hypothetical protein